MGGASDAVAEDASDGTAENSSHRIYHAHRESGMGDVHAMNAAEKRRQGSSNRVEVKVHESAGERDPPESRYAEHWEEGSSGSGRLAHLASAAFRLAQPQEQSYQQP